MAPKYRQNVPDRNLGVVPKRCSLQKLRTLAIIEKLKRRKLTMSKLSYEKSLINDSRKGAFRVATLGVTDSLILRLRKSPDHQGDGLALAFSHLSESEN